MISLISDQPMPNFMPAICDSPDFDVRELHLITSDKKGNESAAMRDVCENRGIRCHIHNVGSAYEYNNLIDQFTKILDELKSKKDKILINLTGGTKVMTLAMQMAASRFKPDENISLFYVREDNYKGIWLDKPEDEEFEIDASPTLKEIINAHTFIIEKPSSFTPSAQQRDFASWLLKEYSDKPEIISCLNRLSDYRGNRRNNIRVEFDKKRINAGVRPVLDRAEKAGLLKQYDDHIFYKTKNLRKFVCGGWLEVAVAEVLKKIRYEHERLIKDIDVGYQIKNGYELDVLVSTPRGLTIIECKTAKYGNGEGCVRVVDLIEQASRQKIYGGLKTREIIVSINELTNRQALQRAEERDIRIIDGARLAELEKHLIECLR